MTRIIVLSGLIALLPSFVWAAPTEEIRKLGPVFVTEPVATFAGPTEPFAPPVRVEKPRADFEVLNAREVHHPQSSVTYRRVAPPEELPNVRERAKAPKYTEQELEVFQREWLSKSYESFHISVTVYDEGDFSEIRWRHDGRPYQILTDIDFRLFRGLTNLETANKRFFVSMAFEEVSSEQVKRLNRELEARGIEPIASKVPEKPEFIDPAAEYVIVEGREAFPGERDPFAFMNWLCLYHDEHKAELLESFAQRQAYQADARAWREANPPPARREITLTYWPGKNSVYLDQNAQ